MHISVTRFESNLNGNHPHGQRRYGQREIRHQRHTHSHVDVWHQLSLTDSRNSVSEESHNIYCLSHQIQFGKWPVHLFTQRLG